MAPIINGRYSMNQDPDPLLAAAKDAIELLDAIEGDRKARWHISSTLRKLRAAVVSHAESEIQKTAARYAPTVGASDDFLRAYWKAHGGRFHGPNVETGTMPESQLLPFMRKLIALNPKEEK